MAGGVVQNLSYILLGEDRSASKAMQAAESTAQKVTGSIGSAFSKLGGVIGGEFGGMLQSAGAGITELSEKGKSLSASLEVGGAITTGAGVALLNLGSGAKQASDQLDAAIVANGESTEHFASQIDDAVKSGENYNHSAEDTKQALTNLIPATGSTSAALSYMNVVTNLAAARHLSLADASTQVAKILQGSGARTLTQYGIAMDGVGSKTQQGQKALDELSQKLDGQAKASVNNFGGQVDVLKTKVEDFIKDAAEPVGQVMTVVGPVFTVAGLAVDIYKTKQEAAALATVAATTATESATVATEAETAAMTGLDTAMDANPIGAVAGALGVLAAVVGSTTLISGTINNTQATDAFTTALEGNTGAINENLRAIATKQLLDSGALKAAQDLGISTSLVVDATLGDAKAKAALEAQVKPLTAELDKMTEADNRNAASGGVASQATAKLGDELTNLGVGIQNTSSAYQSGKAQADLYNSGLKTTADNASGAATNVGALASQLNNLGRVSPGAVQIDIAPKSTIKAHAAGGSFVTNSATMLTPYDVAGEAGPERVDITPLNAGRPQSGGTTELHIHFDGMVYGDPNAFGKAAYNGLIQVLRGGNSKVELKHALGF